MECTCAHDSRRTTNICDDDDDEIFPLGTCEASRFEFKLDDSNLIQFESNGLIRNFRISRTCRLTTKHAHCSTKKLQLL